MEKQLKIHFVSELPHEPSDEASGELGKAEIILKDQVVLSKESSSATENKPQTQVLKAGENTALSEDGTTVTALIAGYPLLIRNESGEAPSLQVDIVPLLSVSEDNMQAMLTLYPPPAGTLILDEKTLKTILHQEGVTYGIDQATLAESIAKQAVLDRPLRNIRIARGILPINGKNASLRFEVETGPIPGKILKDGTIDFRDRKIFTGVDEQQLIATRVPQTNGTPGMNVLGKIIPPQPGVDVTVKVSGDVNYLPETGRVIATKAGVLSIVNDNDIKVSAKQIIPGDVDFSVGNIESKDSVDIKGSVHSGFHIKTKGDLVIGGNVEGATLSSRANVVVRGGLLGESTKLVALGDADINFTERAEIIAGGEIIIRKGAYYSTVSGAGSILCSPESKIIGGDFCCAGNFTGGNVGSLRGGAATVAAGVDGKRYRQYKKLQAQIVDLETKLETLSNREKEKGLVEEIKRTYTDDLQRFSSTLRKLNLIPASPKDSLNDSAFSVSTARIVIHGTAAIGTLLRIGNHTTTLDDEYSAVEFVIEGEPGSIVAKVFTESRVLSNQEK